MDRYLDDELSDLYRRANLLFPQVEIGIVPMVGDLMLRRGAARLMDSLTLPFSREQVARIRQGMNRAHAARCIPALSHHAMPAAAGGRLGPDDTINGVRLISDERIQTVWRNIVFYTIDAMLDCVRVVEPAKRPSRDDSEASYDEMTTALPEAFARSPALLEQVSGVFAATVRALESPEAQRLARKFRDALDFRDVQAGRKALLPARRALHEALADLLVERLPAEQAPFAPIIESRRWRIFRPQMSP